MSILKILTFPDKRLRIYAKEVKEINKKTKKIARDMLDTMYANNGIGLAATQINIPLKIIVIDIINITKNPIILFNPKFLKKYGKIKTEEGCLSIPNKKSIIERYSDVEINAQNYYGKYINIKAQSLLSICIQHEMDHLIGKLFIDY